MGATAFATTLLALGPIGWVQATGQRGIVAEPVDLAPAPVAIVFGAGIRTDGTPSTYLTRRLEGARTAYEAGTVGVILVSGDNGTRGYDEPSSMRDWLVARGVPTDRVVLDYAGFDTHDTCVRAVEVFGVTEAVLFTQDYHLPRAMASCRGAGIQVQGVGVSSAGAGERLSYYRFREVGASWKAWWDGTWNRSPRYPGPPETTVTDALRDAGWR